jgi:predicted metal-binding transcription factor (methanogenesis marker protein 9)
LVVSILICCSADQFDEVKYAALERKSQRLAEVMSLEAKLAEKNTKVAQKKVERTNAVLKNIVKRNRAIEKRIMQKREMERMLKQ